MSQELFPNLPEQKRPHNERLDLTQLDRALQIASSGNFDYEREVKDGHQIITAYGKGLYITFKLDTIENTVTRVAYRDSYTESDGSRADVAPRALDTDHLLTEAENEIKGVLQEQVDPSLIE